VVPSLMDSSNFKIPRTFSMHVNFELFTLFALKKLCGVVGTVIVCGVDGPGFE
jgi:hypothetical protein